MRKMVCCSWLVVCGFVASAQLADQLPDTLNTNNVIGSYVYDKSGSISKISIKRNHNYSISSSKSVGKEATATVTGEWKIVKDTLFFMGATFKNNVIKLVMHNGSLHFIRKDGSSDPSVLMTKKDYKYYQRQCRQSGK